MTNIKLSGESSLRMKIFVYIYCLILHQIANYNIVFDDKIVTLFPLKEKAFVRTRKLRQFMIRLFNL